MILVCDDTGAHGADFGEGGAAGTLAALDAKSVFIARVVSPAQVDLAERHDDRLQYRRPGRKLGVGARVVRVRGSAGSVVGAYSVGVRRSRDHVGVLITLGVRSHRCDFGERGAARADTALDAETAFVRSVV